MMNRKLILNFLLIWFINGIASAKTYEFVDPAALKYTTRYVAGFEELELRIEFNERKYPDNFVFLNIEDIEGEHLSIWKPMGPDYESPLKPLALYYNPQNGNIYGEFEYPENLYNERILLGNGERISDSFKANFLKDIKFLIWSYKRGAMDGGGWGKLIVIFLPKSSLSKSLLEKIERAKEYNKHRVR